VPPILPINMTSITDKTACAKRDGPTFIETIRVDAVTLECPGDMVPCSIFTSFTDTVCISPSERHDKCPIIDILVVHEAMVEHLKGHAFKVTEIGYPQDDGFSTFIAFSQFTTRREVGQEPIISTSINSVLPCYGPFQDNLVLSKIEAAMITFPFDKEKPIEQCPSYDWRILNNRNDGRYNVIGSTSLYMLQYSNGVYQTLNSAVGGFQQEDLNDYLNARLSVQMFVMTRKRYRWNYECAEKPQDYFNKL